MSHHTSFVPNPLQLRPNATVQGKGLIKFENATVYVQYSIGTSCEAGAPLTVLRAFRSNSVPIDTRSWKLEDCGPVHQYDGGDPRIRLAQLTFKGLELSERNAHIEKKNSNNDKPKPLSEEESKDRALYDAFIAGDRVQLDVVVGEVLGAKPTHVAGLILELDYGRPCA